MRTLGARDVARRVLARVREGAYATLALGAELDRSSLEPKDRGFATELVYGVLRRRSRLDRAIAAFSRRGLAKLDEVALDALRLGAYQLLFLRVPPHAAVNETIEAIKRSRGARLAGFANAVLRQLAERGEPKVPDDPLEALLTLESCPRWIYDCFANLVGGAEAESLVRAMSEAAPLGVRVSPRSSIDAVTLRIRNERPNAEIVLAPLVPNAVLVRGAGALHETRAYLEGLFTLQDPGAQLASHLLDPRPGEKILDACAGVGGKSTHLAELCRDEATIDAVDLSEQKLALAKEHALRLGLKSVRTRALDLRLPLPDDLGPYDRILLDAPCSGLGTLRRHPEAKWQRDVHDLSDLAQLQDELLDGVAERLRPGGLLLYSVCTLTKDEGPARIAAFLERHVDFVEDEKPRLVLPHRDGADGFFLARLRRRTHS